MEILNHCTFDRPILDWAKEVRLEALSLYVVKLVQTLHAMDSNSFATKLFLDFYAEIAQKLCEQQVVTEKELAQQQKEGTAQNSAAPRGVQTEFASKLRWDRNDQSLLINGELFTPEDCSINKGETRSKVQRYFALYYGQDSYQYELATFLTEWFDDNDYIMVQTSGSTGAPKKMHVKKEWMSNSAALTLEHLGLCGPENRALACMQLPYIGSKMVVVRALLGNLHILTVPPSSTPLKNPLAHALHRLVTVVTNIQAMEQEKGRRYIKGQLESYQRSISDFCMQLLHAATIWHAMRDHLDFAAMVPMQVYSSLDDEALDRIQYPERYKPRKYSSKAERLAEIPSLPWSALKTLLIGGGEIKPQLQEKLQYVKTKCYSTYGMTETVSHIALRLVNGPQADEWYYPLSSQVKLSQDANYCLRIEAPMVSAEIIQTHDQVEFNDKGGFKILGRSDNVINSGGVKFSLEVVEKELESAAASMHKLEDWEFQATMRPDEKFGQILVLLYTYKGRAQAPDFKHKLLHGFIHTLPKYHQPKLIIECSLPRTATGKPDRSTAARLAIELVGSSVQSRASEK